MVSIALWHGAVLIGAVSIDECTIFRACLRQTATSGSRMFGTLAAVVIALGGVLVTEAAVPTHVLFFLIDDLGYADVGYHGNPVGSKVFTPTIDALSGDGVRLESYYGQCVRACVRVCVRACVRAIASVVGCGVSVWVSVWTWVGVGVLLVDNDFGSVSKIPHALGTGVRDGVERRLLSMRAHAHTRTCTVPRASMLFPIVSSKHHSSPHTRAIAWAHLPWCPPHRRATPTHWLHLGSPNGIAVNFLCSPTRTSLMSGRYAYSMGMNAEVIVDGQCMCACVYVSYDVV
jgi:hypothetical protein